MKTYGLIGHPLGHSFSSQFFTDKFENEDIDAKYLNFDIPSIDDIMDVIASNPNLAGFNVTIPYKQKIMPYLDEINREAREIGAVNVVRVYRNGPNVILKGYNSDIIGFRESITPLLHSHHQKALILGTGGAAKSVKYVLEKKGLETVFVSRYTRPGTVSYKDIDSNAVKEYEVIVNCTPVGMYPKENECPALPYEHLSCNNLLYDLVYNPEHTLFLKRGQQQGAAVKNGLEMLILQAIASWEIWNM
jgi:shikimate dehydrogenase